ncbi:EF-hand domain-containing protein [Escherichia coli]|nr:EF-hand domain-containing protein [Escherichia coli]
MTRQEFGEIFEDFDTNDDGLVYHAEFMAEWRRMELGDAMSAIVLFNRTDTDGDGIITSDPDLDRVFVLFDLDGDHLVSEPEFVIVWTSLST